jgi:hypothetical protein
MDDSQIELLALAGVDTILEAYDIDPRLVIAWLVEEGLITGEMFEVEENT